ncbi:MAG: MFS transporter [Phycisphaerales bacterium]|nr:MFS transporter [Phycisphaerales bacterium]
MSTPALSTTAASKPLSDFRSLGPWYIAAILHSYAATLFSIGCYDFADKQLHASAATRLWLSAIWGFGYIFIAIVAGKFTVKYGPRRFLSFMLPACLAAQLLALLILPTPVQYGIPVLIVLMILLNVTSSSCWPALETATSRSPAKMPLSTRMAIYNICWSTTGFAAVFTKGVLQEVWWGLIFVGPAIATLGICVLLFGFSIPDAMMGQENVPEEAHDETEIDTPAMRRRAMTLLHMAWISNAMSYVAGNVISPVLIFLAMAAWVSYYGHEVSLTVAGIVTSVSGLARMAGFILTMKCKFWHYKARWLVGAQAAMTLAFLMMLTWHQPLALILTQVIFGLALALIYSSSLYYAMHTSEGSGEHAGFHEALIGAGMCVGPAIGALAAAGASTDFHAQLGSLHRVAYVVTGLLLLGTAAMAYLAMRRGDKVTG